MRKIKIFNTKRDTRIRPAALKKLARAVFSQERGRKKVKLGIILCDDAHITELNKKYLSKEYSTDVLSFILEQKESYLEGEIYINLDKVTEQAGEYEVSFENELCRILIHGVLHILGYRDTTESARKKMSEREDFYLSAYFNRN